MKNKQWLTDAVFVFGVICTLVFGLGQFYRTLTTATGVSLMWYVFWEGFLLLNWRLAVQAHRQQPSRVTLQAKWSYVLWIVMVTLDIAVIAWKRNVTWDSSETLTTILGVAGIFMVLAIAKMQKLSVANPWVKCWLAIICKSVPQFVMAYKLSQTGGDGILWTTIAAGHLTIAVRLIQLFFSLLEKPSDRNRWAGLISEGMNETSWIVVTAFWW